MNFRFVFVCLCVVMCGFPATSFCWGFYAHQQINYYAVFLLPPEMMTLYKPNIRFLSEHAVDPDKRRYAVAEEGARHYIDIDRYGRHPFPALPRGWRDAVAKYSEDTLTTYGIVPWWIEKMLGRLTSAFREHNRSKILKLSAEIGHYIADSHVPLHVSSNHNGQLTGQQGIHGFWESRIPEMLAASSWDFFIGKAAFIDNPSHYIWSRVLESGMEADTALLMESNLNKRFPADRKYAFENRNGIVVKQYSAEYTLAYYGLLNNMVERRMRLAIFSTASFWFTAWVNAGQPDLRPLAGLEFAAADSLEFEALNAGWKAGSPAGMGCEE